MDHQPLVACGHCGLGNRRTSEQCFICGRPLTGLEVEVPDRPSPRLAVPPVDRSTESLPQPRAEVPQPQPQPEPQRQAVETMALGSAGEPPGRARWATRHRRTAVIAAAGAVVIAVGAVVWTVSDQDEVSDPWALRAAVTEKPELAWTWDAGKEIHVVSPMDQGALVVLGGGEVAALGEDGAVRWRLDAHPLGYATFDPATEAVHVLRYGAVDMTSTVTSLDAATGEERWIVPGQMVTTVGDATIVMAPDEVRRVDTADGSEIWSLSVDGYGAAVSEDAVYAFSDGDLHAWDLDGDEVWVSDAASTGSSSGFGASVVALDDFIVASVPGSEVIGLDPETGDERWREEAEDSGGGVGAMGPGLAYLFPASGQVIENSPSASSESPDETPVYDKDGEVGTIPRENDYVAPVAVEIDGDPHVVELGSGRLYDEDLEQVGTVPVEDSWPTLTGVYDVGSDGSIGYVPYGADEPVWTLDGSFQERNLVAGDEVLLVSDAETVSLYR